MNFMCCKTREEHEPQIKIAVKQDCLSERGYFWQLKDCHGCRFSVEYCPWCGKKLPDVVLRSGVLITEAFVHNGGQT
jgi:hypothetical protein